MERGQLLIDDRLETAFLHHPLREGWVDAPGVQVQRVTAADAAQAPLALVDSIVAAELASTHVVLRDIAVVWSTASLITLMTHTRPDEVEQVQVAFGDVAPAGRAAAIASVQPFYGIEVSEWVNAADGPVDATHARVEGGPAALIAVDETDQETYQEDLGRTWFLLTDLPFVSHVCICPAARLTSDPRAVAEDLAQLRALLDAGLERGREVRRDLAKQHGIDRDTLTESFSEVEWVVENDSLRGLRELYRRSMLATAANRMRAVWVTRPAE